MWLLLWNVLCPCIGEQLTPGNACLCKLAIKSWLAEFGGYCAVAPLFVSLLVCLFVHANFICTLSPGSWVTHTDAFVLGLLWLLRRGDGIKPHPALHSIPGVGNLAYTAGERWVRGVMNFWVGFRTFAFCACQGWSNKKTRAEELRWSRFEKGGGAPVTSSCKSMYIHRWS